MTTIGIGIGVAVPQSVGGLSENARITEDGEERVTESGESREVES